MAKSIREKANESSVPIFRAPPLARAIYFTTELNDSVPETLYYAVAQVIAYVFSLNSLGVGATIASKPNPDVPKGMHFSADGKIIDD
jgi:flagellar biosynthetic protein FlhB